MLAPILKMSPWPPGPAPTPTPTASMFLGQPRVAYVSHDGALGYRARFGDSDGYVKGVHPHRLRAAGYTVIEE